MNPVWSYFSPRCTRPTPQPGFLSNRMPAFAPDPGFLLWNRRELGGTENLTGAPGGRPPHPHPRHTPVCEIGRRDSHVNLGLQLEPGRRDIQGHLVQVVLRSREVKASDPGKNGGGHSLIKKKNLGGGGSYLVERHAERAAEGAVVVLDGDVYA